MDRVTISLDENPASTVDELIRERGYATRRDPKTALAAPLYLAAERLVAAGSVSDVRVLHGGKVVTGLVGDDEGDRSSVAPHRVYIQFRGADGMGMHGECSCGGFTPCVHVAAVSIAAAGSRANPAVPHLDTAARAPRRTPDRVSITAPRQQLCYVVEVHSPPTRNAPSPRGVGLSIWVATRSMETGHVLPDGVCLFAPRTANGPGEYPRYVDPADRDILQTLNARQGETRWELRDAAGFDVLQRAIATGRAHWGSLQGPALRAGAARRLRFAWQVLPDGAQRLQCDSGAALEVLVDLEPIVFIDPESRELGPVECGHADLLRAYWSAPPIPPEAAGAVNERIGRDAGGGGFPSLRAMIVRRAPGSPLRGRLVLAGGPTATVFFLFNGMAVDLGSLDAGQDQVRRFDGDTVWEIDRDREAERQLLAALQGVLPEIPGQRAAWLAFMRNTIPRLEAAGWQVDIDPGFPYRIAAAEDWYAELTAARRQEWFDLNLGILVDGEPVDLLPALVDYLEAERGASSGGASSGGASSGGAPSGGASPGSESAAGGESAGTSLTVAGHLFIALEDGRYLPVAVERIRRIADTLVELFDRDDFDADHGLSLPFSQAGRLAELALESNPPALRSSDPALLARIAELADFPGIEPLQAPASFRAELRPYQQEGLGWLQFLRRHARGGILADDMGLGKTVQTLAHLALEKEQGRLRHPSLIVAPVSVLGNWRQEIERFAPQLTLLTLHGAKRRESFAALGRADIVLTSYPLLQADSEILLARSFYYLILDEAQIIKNPRAKVSQAARALRAEHRLCLTGTPMENHLGDLWSLFEFLQPGLLGDEKQFQRQYRTPIEKQGDEARARALSRRIRPFLVRRSKDAVARDLPPKMQIVEYIALDEPQRDFYDGIRLAMHRRVREAIRLKGLARSHITVLDALLKLRQACCDPRLVAPAPGSDPARAAVPPSAKLQWLSTSLPELIAEGRRVLLFSQFTSMLRLIEAQVQALEIPYQVLTGATRDRTALIDGFQAGAVPLFLISLKAGGTGLNLTAADTVIHFDPWWNPAAEMQATDRAHRIGQDKPVFVYKLIAEGTIEEKIMQLQAGKHGLLSRLYSDQNASPTQLGTADVEALFEP